MDTAFVFPGQGSQKIGMCAAFTSGFKSGQETIEEIEDAISFKISKIISEGPEEELTLTHNAQIALFAASMATFNVLKHEFGFEVTGSIKYMAGHSLGEYTALCAASVLSLKDSARLIKKRGELMAQAASGNNFCMEAIIELNINKVEEILKPYQSGRNICVIANDNSNSQVIISGTLEAVTKASKKAIEEGAKKTIRLNTSGPFHSPLMANAAIELDSILANLSDSFMDFKTPVIMNVTATPLENQSQIHPLLVQQITDRVRWRETINFMANSGIKQIIEIGPGKVLTKISKRTHPEIEMFGIETVTEMESLLLNL